MSAQHPCQRTLTGFSTALVFLGFSAPLFAQHIVATVSTGGGPAAVAVNPNTNKIYVLNHFDNTVSVIDGATESVTSVPLPVNSNPTAVVVNPATNKVYVANFGSTSPTPINGSVTIINGNTLAPTTIAVGNHNNDIALNPATNTIYVADESGTIGIINGSNDTFTNLSVGLDPTAIAVNPATDKVYIANYENGNVTIIDAANNNAFTTLSVGINPDGIAANAATNKIYVANQNSIPPSVTVIDAGNSNSTSTITVDTAPETVVIDQSSNTIYVANAGSNTVTVIDGTGHNPTVNVPTGLTGATAFTVAVNQATHLAYAAGVYADGATCTLGTITVIKGTAANGTFPLTGCHPSAIGINPGTDRIYTANDESANVTVIDGSTAAGQATVKLAASGNPTALGANVTFTAGVTGQNGTPTGSITFFDGDTILGSPNLTAGSAALSNVSTLNAGDHLITAVYSGDSNYASSSADISHAVLSGGATGTTTAITAVTPTGSSNSSAMAFFGTVMGQPALTLQATITPAPPAGEQVVFLEDTPSGVPVQVGAPQALDSSGVATFPSLKLSLGLHNFRAAYLGDGNDAGSESPTVSVDQSPKPKPR